MEYNQSKIMEEMTTMVDVKAKVLGDMFHRVFLLVTYKDDYLNDVVREFELLGFSPENFLANDIDYFRRQLKTVEEDLDFVANELESCARDYTSKISSRDFLMLDKIIDEMVFNAKRVEEYTKIREAMRAAIFYLEKQ